MLPFRLPLAFAGSESIFLRPEDFLLAAALILMMARRQPLQCPWPLIAFLCAQILAALFGILRPDGPLPVHAAIHLAQYAKLALTFLLVRTVVPASDDIARAWMLPLLVCAGWGLAESFLQHPEPDVAVTRTFEHAPFDSQSNAYAGLFVLGIFVSAGALKSRTARRTIPVATLLLCLAALPGTRSLEAIAALFAGVALLSLLSPDLSPPRRTYLAGCVLFIMITLAMVLCHGFPSFDARAENWARLLRVGAEHPIFGLGPGRFHRAPYDNQYVMVLVESGLAGLCAFAWMLGSLALHFWTRRTEPDSRSALAALAAVSTQAIAAVCMISNVPAGPLWWIMGAILCRTPEAPNLDLQKGATRSS
jgi:hypothetical protein